MAYVPGFDHDVFISYAHVDNQPLLEGEKGWVTKFGEHLLMMLNRHVMENRPVSVWRDKKLEGIDEFADTIDAAFRKTAVFVCIMSRRYLTSEWCGRELDGFWNNEQDRLGPRVGNKVRVCKATILDVPVEEHPEVIRGALGYDFYDDEPPEGLRSQYEPTHTDSRYWRRIDELSKELAGLLDTMAGLPADDQEEPPPPRDATSRPAVSSGSVLATVFLAEVADDLADERFLLKRELEKHNVRVLPDGPLPNNRAEMESAVRQALEVSELSVHMLGTYPGRRFADDENVRIPHFHFDLATSVAGGSNTQLERLVWIPPRVTATTLHPTQKKFINSVRNEGGCDTPLDVQEGDNNVEMLQELILQKITEPVFSGPPTRRAMIYVTGEEGDFGNPEAQAMIQWLSGRHDVYQSPLKEDEKQRELHEETNIKYCDGLLILYGDAPKDWVAGKAMQARDLTTGKKRSLIKAVYDGPPADKEELGLIIQDVEVLTGRGKFSPKSMQRFVTLIEND